MFLSVDVELETRCNHLRNFTNFVEVVVSLCRCRIPTIEVEFEDFLLQL